jgi:hypothetical protein
MSVPRQLALYDKMGVEAPGRCGEGDLFRQLKREDDGAALR